MKQYDILKERKKTAYPLGPAVTDFFFPSTEGHLCFFL